jgi:small-conductance mechanosensitive channel
MRKALILTLKLLALIALTMVYMGEVDLTPLYVHIKSKYRPLAVYYVSVLSALAVFLILLDFIQVTIIWLYRRRAHMVGDDNFVIGIRHLYSIILVVGLVVGLLSLFQIHIRDVLTSISIIFAGLAILTKDYVSNMINGMILTFSGQISIGDNIRIGQHRGKIIDITLQNIHLINDDDDVIYIPNNTAMNTDIINYTRRPIKRISLEFEIDLRYLNTIEELEQYLIETLQPFHDQIQPDSYYLRVAEVDRSSVACKFQYILRAPDKDLERTIRRTVVRRLVQLISTREKYVDKISGLPTADGEA